MSKSYFAILHIGVKAFDFSYQGVNAYTMVDHTCFTVTTVTSKCLLSILPTFIDHILRCPFSPLNEFAYFFGVSKF